jgi:hypothetical protein
MEKALIAVKSIIDIDDDVFTDFSYSSTFSNWETREGLIWNFYWSADNAYLYALATEDGTLLQFHTWQFDSRNFGFAEISREAAIASANAFIRNANPRTHQYFKAPEHIHTNLHSSEYSLLYNAEINGYAFPAAQVNVSVNKFTGMVTGYSSRNVDPGRFRFESAADLISESAAADAYAAHIGLSLEYMSRFDFDKRELTVFPAYVFNSQGDRFISAKSGEVVAYVYDLGAEATDAMLGGGAGAPMAAEALSEADGMGRQANITPAERAAIEQVAGFITSEQALEKLLEAAGLSGLDVRHFDDQHISLNRDFFDNNRFLYNVSLFRHLDWDAADDEISGFFGRIDAATGRVMSFNFFYHGIPVSSGTEMTVAQVEAAVDAFLTRMAPTELARARLENRQDPMPERFGPRGGNFHFNYVRFENDVPFRENGISVTFNQNTGKVTGFSLNWYDGVTFPSVSSVLTPHMALSAFVDQNGSEIIYVTTGEGNARIVFDFSTHAYIDPFTGKAVDFSGQAWAEVAVTPEYDDVIGHWSERFVMRLLENGVYKWGGAFEPDKVMTELEFLQYIMLIEQPWLARMEPLTFFAQRGINVEASADRQVTRQEAARIMVQYLGYGRLAEQSQWFVYPFNDSVADEYKGFITIFFMLGIVTGDENGMFNATSNVTRGQAAVMLHNMVLARS